MLRCGFRLAAVLPVVVLVAACGGSGSSPTTPSGPAAQLPGLSDMLADMTLGSASAPNTIIEYSSFTCPHCANFHSGQFLSLRAQDLDTGKAKFIFRDFPRNAQDQAAGMLARCVGASRYFEAVTVLFAQQSNWAGASDYRGALAGIMASQFGMTRATVDQCLAMTDLQNGILQVQADGRTQYGVTGTPTFVVNGTVLSVYGNATVADFERYFK